MAISGYKKGLKWAATGQPTEKTHGKPPFKGGSGISQRKGGEGGIKPENCSFLIEKLLWL